MPFNSGALSKGENVQITVAVNIGDGGYVTIEIIKVRITAAYIGGQKVRR